MYLLCSLNSVIHSAWNPICPSLDPYDARLKLYTQIIYLLISTTSFLPTRVFMERTKAHEQPAWASCLSDEQQHLLPLKRTGYTEHREKTAKLGLERWRWTMQEGGCQVLWSGILLPTPTTSRSLFLPAMYCSLHLSHYEPHLLKEARQNNETMRAHCRERCQCEAVDMWFVTPSWCFLNSLLISLTFSVDSNSPLRGVHVIFVTFFWKYTLNLDFKYELKHAVTFSN